MSEFYTYVKKYGNNLFYRGYSDSGSAEIKSIAYKPTLYVPTHEDSEYTSIDGQKLEPVKFENIKQSSEFIEQHRDICNFKLFGHNKPAYAFIAEKYKNKEVEYDFNLLRTFFLDIETYAGNGFPDAWEATEKITAITIYDSYTRKYITWGVGKYITSDINVTYYDCKSESSLLGMFVDYWSANYPDIVSGWNSRLYDYPYIVNRIRKILGEDVVNRLSPFGVVMEKNVRVARFGKTTNYKSYDIWGIAELDYMDLYIKYDGNKEEHSLNYISYIELGESKLEYDGSLHELYTNDYQKYIDYNIKDVSLLVRLDDKKNLLALLVGISYASKVASYEDTLGTTRGWETLIYSHLFDSNIIAPLKTFDGDDKSEKYPGAFVRPPKAGKYNWVVSYDVASLYPSVIRQVNIGVETRVDPSRLPEEVRAALSNVNVDNLVAKKVDTAVFKKYGLSLAANGVVYTTDKQSFLSELMEKFFNQRTLFKGEMKKHKVRMHELEKELKNRGLR